MKNQTFESVPLLRIVVSLMAGIVVGEYLTIVLPLGVMFVLLVVVALLMWKFPLLQSVAIAVCFVVLGMLLIQRQKQLQQRSWPEGEVCYEAVVLSNPVEKPKTMAVDILLPANHQKLKCYLYKDERSRRLSVGDGLQIQSRIQENSEWRVGSFDYRRYLEIHGFTGRTYVSSWKWQKAQVSLSNLSYLERTKLFFLKQRSQLLKRLQGMAVTARPSVACTARNFSLFPLHFSLYDAHSVVAAMALGDKSALTKELKDTYAVTGASHILALSGLHLGIIYTLLVLLTGGRRKLFSIHFSLFTILGIWAFVFLVGLSTSVVRSALMLSLYALLSLGHRDKMSVNTLAFAAIVLLMINPLSLFDVGFQMSFMAVFSILLFYPLFEGLFSPEYLLSHRVVRWVWGMVAVSCAAQIGVAPLIAYYFGRFSTYFLLTNFIVIPAATLILWLSLLVLIIPSFAYLLLYIVGLLNAILTKMATLPGASIDGLHPTILQVAMIYVIIASCYLLVLRLHRQKL
jgi:competence protein ComEC